MKRLKKLIGTVLQLIFFVGLAVLLITFFSSRISLIGLRSFTVVTGSMEPAVHVGSVVFTLPRENYEVGNIITFKRGDISVTHRVVAIKNGLYQTKGDANNTSDSILVTKANIIGKDFYIVPYLGKFIVYLKTVPGFGIFIFLPILFYILIEARIFKREWEKEIEKKIMEKISPFGFKIS